MALTVLENVSLSDKNWFRTGGTARYYTEPRTDKEFQQALFFACDNKLSVFVLGEGANILVSDTGYQGLVIRPIQKDASISSYSDAASLVTVKAGMNMQSLIDFCLNNNLVGLHEFSGIPGTVGGSLFVNLHYFEFFLSEFLYSADVIEKKTGSIHTVSPDWFCFGYNKSTLYEEDFYLLSATFLLNKATNEETWYARGRSAEIVRYRHRQYPHKNTCGSFFRNFYEHEVSLIKDNKKMIYVAYYLDKVGIRGTLSHQSASISYQHANMFITQKNAASQDVVTLARIAQQKVYDKFRIIPQPECRFIGFREYPLLLK